MTDGDGGPAQEPAAEHPAAPPTSRPRERLRLAIRAARADPGSLVVRAGVLAALLASAAFLVAPLYWLFSAALRPPGSLSVPPSLLPPSLTLATIGRVLTETAFATYLANSLYVSAATVVLTLGVGLPAAYALSWYDLPRRRLVMVTLLVVQMIPIVALVIPLYRVFGLLGLLDSLTVVVLADTVLAAPVVIWLLTGYFDTLPPRLEEAARVCGASRARAVAVIVPLARPGIVASALYAFVVSWNQFVIPLTFTSSQAVRTVPLGLYTFVGRYGVVNWELLGAASLVAMAPVLLLFVAFQRQFVSGLVGTGMRGG